MAAKINVHKDKMLFSLILDLRYACADYESYIEEHKGALKNLQSSLRKAKRKLAKAEEEYERIHGSKPLRTK